MGRDGRGRFRGLWQAAAALAMYGIACHVSVRFAQAALNGLSLPAMAIMHRLTACVPFPLTEPAVLCVATIVLFTLAAAVIRAMRARGPRPLRGWLSGLAWTALALGGCLLLLWEPARALPVDAPSTPDAGQLEWLCGELIDALNASPLSFPDAGESMRLAPSVAGLPGRAVKAARYPEWMGVAHISGLFVPLTGEAIVDASVPAPLIPFTAVHELMHLGGIADEGAANIGAWQRCLSAGGAFADSARLWALRYALSLLGRADELARVRCYTKMEDALSSVFHDINGEAAITVPSIFSLSLGDYAALVGYLTG